MVDRKRTAPLKEEDEKESKPRVKRETLKDLDPKEIRSDDVKGGGTTPGWECENATA